jgi:hypothetical protein
MDQLRLELDQIRNQNAALTLEIAQLEALDRIEARARELGLAPTTDVRYLPVTNYPMPLEPEEPVLAGISARSSLNSNGAEFDLAAWWIVTLDNFAAWLEGRE